MRIAYKQIQPTFIVIDSNFSPESGRLSTPMTNNILFGKQGVGSEDGPQGPFQVDSKGKMCLQSWCCSFSIPKINLRRVN